MPSEYLVVLAAVRKALGDVTTEAVRQRRARIQAAVSMPNDIALYVLAHQLGLQLHRMVTDPATLERVAYFAGEVASHQSADGQASTGPPRKVRSETKRVTVVTVGGIGVTQLPGMTAAHAKEAQEMASVYAAMYVFENSLRDVIERVLRHKFGNDWWAQGVPPKTQEVAAARKADEQRDPWHGKRGARPIDYVDLSALARIVRHNRKLFEKIFPSTEWLEVLVTHDMNVSRRVVAHMNPLAVDDVKNVENAMRKYAKVLQANEAEIP